MKSISALLLLPLLAFSQSYHQYVNPFIGTGGHGHTFPGATVPFGMVQLSPDTRIDGSWDGCSGYHYSDSVIYGFSHTHLSGTGVSDFGDILLMPTMGEPDLSSAGYASTFSHDNERASAGYYQVKLDDDAINVELTTSSRVGFHRYTFARDGQANIILDLNHRDKLLQGEIRIVDPQTVEVLRRSEAWARDQYVYARLSFDRPMRVTAVNNNGFAPAKTSDTFFAGTVLALSLSSEVKAGETIQVRVALSPTGYEGARRNMGEVPHWSFDQVKRDAEDMWNAELSKIQVTSSDANKLSIFYTALYHTMIQPNIAQDVDGQYRGRDNQIHLADGFDYYTVFSLWDTFRATHPLYTLIDKKRTSDFINTFIKQYEQGGALPVWELASNETGCMIGYHAVPVIADAMAKGIKGFDYEQAYEASKHSAMLDHLGLDAYKKQGFITIDDEHESVSKTLEYAYDDWCIAQMADMLNKPADKKLFGERSQYWKNLFDTGTGLMRPKRNNAWDVPFDPREVNNNFTEGNSWQYSFFVPHDIPGLIAAHGSKKDFEQKLDELFTAPSATTGREQVDITGLIGQYAHGNEPSHHMAYLYNEIGRPEKTREKVHYILNTFYKNAPDGLIGNEDCGQMSAWYVLSAMGLYSTTPGQPRWSVTEPLFDSIKVRFEDGTTGFIGRATPAEDREYFGFKHLKSSYHHDAYEPIVSVPVFGRAHRSFYKKLDVSLSGSGKLYYRIGQKGDFRPYVKPFRIRETTVVEAFAETEAGRSKTVSASYVKRPNDHFIVITSRPNPQYTAGGKESIADGIFGNENWRKGDWQGYQSTDFECYLLFSSKRKVTTVSANFLQDSRSWILMPTRVEFYSADSKQKYTLLKTIDNTIDPKDTQTIIKSFTCDVPVKTNRIVVKAYNYGKLPAWHQGAGGDAFIFVDEITVK